jgi:peptidoglycan/xylan/chitin deacetylase (PgdA/CDA1 family)
MRAVLTYHSLDDSGSPISVPPAVFSQHVRWLAGGDVRVLPLGDLLVLDPEDPEPAVAITFDDGFLNFQQAADQLLEQGLPVTLFVVSRHVGGSNAWRGQTEPGIPTLPLLGWSDLERLAGRGVAIGAHTRSHPRLTTLTAAGLDDEIDGCVQDLGKRLGVRVDHFAYPYGDVDERIAAVARRRFQSGLTTRFSTLTRQDPPMWIPRLDMYYLREPGALESWGTSRFRRLLWSVRLRRQLREVLT